MTGRRARPTYEQRMSRAMQFVPGHVGGRVASAQPVQRTGGTLRRPSIGAAAGAPPWEVVIYPDAIYADGSPTVVGGATALSDGSDSTYVEVTRSYTVLGGTVVAAAVANFEATTLPAGTITEVLFRMWMWTPDEQGPSQPTSDVTLAGDMLSGDRPPTSYGSFSPYYQVSNGWDGSSSYLPDADSTWQSFEEVLAYPPARAEIEAGEVQAFLDCVGTGTTEATMTLRYSLAALVVRGTP